MTALALLLALSLPVDAGRRAPQPTVEEGAATLLGQALSSLEAYEELRWLCDHVGHRLAGSPGLEQAVQWGARELEADGLEVSLEPVTVPVWIRGHERVSMTAPLARDLEVTTLGGSVGTGDTPIEAEVMVVGSFDELEERGAEAVGKIVLFDDPWVDYGQAVQYRGHGASKAAAQGAVAALVRSPTPVSLGTPHTGGMRYADDVAQVPAVAITVEDAAWMRRLIAAGETVKVSLDLGAHRDGEAPSHNVVGEVRGREIPEEVVILGCHLDSWDIGQGAQDDGAGCVAAMEAGRLIAALGPRRTVRVVLFSNEEFGLSGGKAYAADHADELGDIIAAVEADTGAGQPQGFRVDMRDPETSERDEALAQQVIDVLAPYLPLLAPIGGPQELEVSWSGADISPMVKQGVPGLGLRHDTSGYWPIHHTSADTFEKIDPQLLARNVAAMAIMGWVLSELPEPLPRP